MDDVSWKHHHRKNWGHKMRSIFGFAEAILFDTAASAAIFPNLKNK
jgi:hypothetical protein